MPIYEYQCQACEHAFETIQSISEPVLSQCPDCGEEQLKKLVSAVAFRLKGNGWYETDFKSGDKKNISTGDDKAGSGKGTSSKSDSKEAAKSGKSDGAATKSGGESKSASS